jgi:hypothetical protein
MEIQLQLKDLYLGSIDAKHELLTNSIEERKQFKDAFLLPENIILEPYLTGRKFFITGLKGTGKTTLLRYLAIHSEEKLGADYSFVLFKSDFTEQDKKDFSRAARTTIVDKDISANDTSDFEVVWRWFLHRHIVDTISESQQIIFEDDIHWKKYVACVKAPKASNESQGIFRLIPKLKRGKIEISANPKLGMEFDWEDTNKTIVNFESITKQADFLFSNLNPKTKAFHIFIDELELSLGQSKQYQRDMWLIRDLIISIEKINTICLRKKFNIKIFCAIRSEVISAVSSLGKEINKIISDFGTQILWHRHEGDIAAHPILEVLLKRIHVAESALIKGQEYSASRIWKHYFPERYQNTEIAHYILFQSWYRPRDIIRLLVISKELFPNEKSFSHKVFDAIKKEYSTKSWIELAEELKTHYASAEIEAIRRLFYGFTWKFSYESLKRHTNELKDLYKEVSELFEKHTLGNVLNDLYKIGVIENSYKRSKGSGYINRAAYRGDDEILLEKDMIIHRALRSYFATT